MATLGPVNTEGYQLPTTGIYDSQTIEALDINSDEFKRFLVYLQTSLNQYALFINNKPSGKLNPSEQISSKTLFSPQGTSLNTDSDVRRTAYWVTVQVGPLGVGAVPFPHNIPNVNNANFNSISIQGAITDTAAFNSIPLPYVGPLGTIGLEIDPTNLIITSSFNSANFNRGYVVIEYAKY